MRPGIDLLSRTVWCLYRVIVDGTMASISVGTDHVPSYNRNANSGDSRGPNSCFQGGICR